MQLDVVWGDAVQPSLGPREPVEDRERARPGTVGDARPGEEIPDRPVRTVLVPVAREVDADVGGGQAAPARALDAQRGAVNPEPGDGVAHDFVGNAQVEQRAERHVAGDAARQVEVQVQPVPPCHGSLFRLTSAAA